MVVVEVKELYCGCAKTASYILHYLFVHVMAKLYSTYSN